MSLTDNLNSDVLHSLKFGLWDFGRRNPLVNQPIRALGRVATRGVEDKYKKQLEASWSELRPVDRYLRAKGISTQVVVVRGPETCEESLSGLSLLLNHLRIPYRSCSLSELLDTDASLVLTCDLQPEDLPNSVREIALCLRDASELLPYRSGLRSMAAAKLISELRSFCKEPLITGMLPARVALRFDDVAGIEIEDYLSPILDHAWRPNLGIFISDFENKSLSKAPWLSKLAKSNQVDLNPHAFSPNEFIFFDYSRGVPFSAAAFSARWQKVLERFENWGFPMSSVINTHFHSLSSSALELMSASGQKYFFSEIAVDSTTRMPSEAHLPSGDPTLTTGQAHQCEFQQIYSGDSTLDCNQPSSLYDFMMHIRSSHIAEDASERILKRLKLSLNCGFASFITSHEYLLSPHGRPVHDNLWQKVEAGLSALYPAEIKKISMPELGDLCQDHTHAVVESVRKIHPRRWIVKLTGKSMGKTPLSIFWNNCINEFNMPPFDGAAEMELSL